MSESKPSCFGIPEICMPRDEHDIIQPQEACNLCNHLQDCLRTAIDACGGIRKLKPESAFTIEESEKPGGIAGAIMRWSERKLAAQKR